MAPHIMRAFLCAGAVRRGSPPTQLSARRSADGMAAVVLAPMRSSSTPPDFFKDGSSGSFAAAAECVPVKVRRARFFSCTPQPRLFASTVRPLLSGAIVSHPHNLLAESA